MELGIWTVVLLLPIGVLLARFLAFHRFWGRRLLETVLAMPLVLPPTVIGYYLLTVFGKETWIGRIWEVMAGGPLAFTFEGLIAASVIANVPFAVQPMQRAFEAIPSEIREAGMCCGMSPWRLLRRVEMPLAWPGAVTAIVLVFAHTLGEFGVVLMVGGNIAGETRTISIAIYDSVQAFDDTAAGTMAAVLLLFSFFCIASVLALTDKIGRRHGK
ncbi:MAG: molybdate ABC transporter permease subunit [Methyloligellaceae bacterium]